MFLVLCSANDLPALWAYRGLQQRGLAPLELVSAELLASSLTWEHRVGSDPATIHIGLADGRRIDGETVEGTLNRLFQVPMLHWRKADPRDQGYVLEELNAFWLSWLHALPGPMFNRPRSQGLGGDWRHESEWVWLASQAGLPVPVYVQSDREQIDEWSGELRLRPAQAAVKTVIVAAGQPCGANAPPDVVEACLRLAGMTGTALLGMDFIEGEAGPWTFAGASSTPDLMQGGEALLDVLASALKGNGPR
jgi:hypothetical protein